MSSVNEIWPDDLRPESPSSVVAATPSVQFGIGVRPNRGLSASIAKQISAWCHRYGIGRGLFPTEQLRGFTVEFRKRKEVIDLIDCEIEIWMGPMHWRGYSFGITTHRAFTRALSTASKIPI